MGLTLLLSESVLYVRASEKYGKTAQDTAFRLAEFECTVAKENYLMDKVNLTVDVEEMLKNIADITYTPISHFNKNDEQFELINSYPDIPFLRTLAENFPHGILTDKPANVMEIEHQTILYGYVHCPDGSFLIIGPIMETAFDNNSAARFIKKLNLPLSDVKNFLSYYDGTSHYSIYRFAKIVKFVCSLFNDNAPQIIDILPSGYKKEQDPVVKTNAPKQPIEENNIIKSQVYEKELYSYIYTGQYKQLKEFLNQRMYDGETVIASNSVMRNNKYLVIVSIALSARTAHQAGASYDTAMKKADICIKKVDEAQTFDELFDIHKHMLLDFAKLVADSRTGKPASSIYYKVENYVSSNLYEKISTADIADALGMSRTYLSTHFKNETGMNLADFINQLKIAEAQRLLLTTDKTLIWISNSLGFSSQSYFAEVFKKFVGCTPKDFRDNPIFANKTKNA